MCFLPGVVVGSTVEEWVPGGVARSPTRGQAEARLGATGGGPTEGNIGHSKDVEAVRRETFPPQIDKSTMKGLEIILMVYMSCSSTEGKN